MKVYLAPRKPRAATKRSTTKALPATVWSVLGPIPVIETEEGLGENDLGSFDYHARVIRVRPGLQVQQRDQTLQHEWVHALIWDAGFHNALTHELEEQICDVIATALVASTL